MRAAPATATIAILGNPNTGKTSLFNAITGLSHKVGNYPGVTVERKTGAMRRPAGDAVVLDIPGTYSLAARSPDEAIAVEVLLGRQVGDPRPDVLVVVVDASNLERNLYLVSQVLEFGLPTVVALNMIDTAARRRISIDVSRLSGRLQVPVLPVRADRREGIDALCSAIERAIAAGPQKTTGTDTRGGVPLGGALEAAIAELSKAVSETTISRPELLRALIDVDGPLESALTKRFGARFSGALNRARASLREHGVPAALEAQARYSWARAVVRDCESRPAVPVRTASERIDALLTHRVAGSAILLATLGLVFQAIYRGSAPLMELIDRGVGWLGAMLGSWFPDGPLRSLLVDGVIGGVGGVLVFLPQILLLFLFIGLLEDCGYMARAAFLMDKVLARAGLSGKAVIPLLSSFACAVPGVMSARVIGDRRDRLATIAIAPLMSCSARLPVYVLLIGAFMPERQLLGGWVSSKGLMLLLAHAIGALVSLPILWLLKRTLLRGPTPPFVMELPEYQWPNGRAVVERLLTRGRAFMRRAGTVIVSVAVIVWALSYFPRPSEIETRYQVRRAATEDPAVHRALEQEQAAEYLAQSVFGRLGRTIEPLVAPLGWDWRIGMAVAASFPAREVVIATMGTIFGLGSEVDENSSDLAAALHAAQRADGSPLFTTPVALSLVVFYALCCQCAATLAVIRRETGSWRWPLLVFCGMTVLAWGGAWLTKLGSGAIGL